ncbi:MAG: tail fiber domain-containing protein [Verrucomicrobiales bacterium]|nr:tail fiber domain-containing protein [Verrucomicrobiales bacterium]
MKTKTVTLSLAALAALPAMALAQGTYLSAPDGNPTKAVIVANGGNVGIGTTTPRRALHVHGGGVLLTGVNPHMAFDADSGIATLSLSTLNEAGPLPTARKNDTILVGQSAANLLFGIGYSEVGEVMRINSSGNVGIGTVAPQAKLHVIGSGLFSGNVGIGTTTPKRALHVHGGDVLITGVNPYLAFGGEGSPPIVALALSTLNGDEGGPLRTARTNDIVLVGQSAANLLFGIGYDVGEVMRINSSGNVGIGTTTPQSKLDVNGKINCTVLELTSDRNRKRDFTAVDGRRVLERLAALPITTWHYTNAPGIRHIGPMAQDFQAAFEVGSDDKHIATVDADGVALAAIQGLYDVVQEKDHEIATLKRRLAELKEEVAGAKDNMARRLAALEKAVSKNALQVSFAPDASR